MPTFAFTGRTRAGENIAGERVADTIDAVTAMLRREQVLVTKVTPVKGKAAASPKKGKLGKGVSAKSLAIFTRQFSVMIDAGLPLVQCLEILGSQEEDANFAATILQTRGDVENGQTLADAMRKHPKTFDPLFTNMIAAGEAGGILDTILKRLATYIEKNVKLKGQVKSAMVYPGRRRRDCRPGRGGHPVEGHPDLRRDVRQPGRRTAAAHAHRHRDERFSRSIRLALPGCHRRGRLGVQELLRHGQGPARRGRHSAEAADPRPDHAQDRRGAVLPHAVDAHQLGRADSRRPRHHGPHLGQRHRGRRDSGDPQEHRGRQHHRGAAEGNRRVSRRWSCR